MRFRCSPRRPWRLLSSLAVLLLGLAGGLPARAATLFDPDAEWRSMETPHFRLNYEARHEAVAQRAARYAEEAYAQVVPFLKAAPSVRTEITLLDHEDTQNGFSVPYPNSMIYIYLTTPDAESLTGRYDHYLKNLLTHEFTHAAHFESLGGTTALINQIFGRALYPNLFQPYFLIEGLAVSEESQYGAGGRAREGDFDMILRMAALDGKLLDIDQASGWSSLTSWPGGGSTYIYGTYFYQYLMERYGTDAPGRIAHEYGQWPWFGINQAISRALPGKTAYGLWDELKVYLKERSQRQLARITKHPVTQSQSVTRTGFYHLHPTWLADGKLLYTEYGPDQSPILKLDPLDGTPGKRLVSKMYTGSYTVSRDRFVYLSANAEFRRYYSYDDLFRLDMKTHRVDRLTTGKRAKDPAVSPDGRMVVATLRSAGTSNLALFDSGGALRRMLTHHTDETDYSGAVYAPDGRTVVVSAWRDGSRDLYRLEPGVSDPVPLWRDSAVELSPAFSADGKTLFFASDRDGGVFNLFAYRMADGKLFQVTNVVGGAIEPAASPDGKQLAFANYGSNGWDIHRMPLDPTTWREVPLEGATAYAPFSGEVIPAAPVSASQPESLANPFPSHAYQPWPTLMPKTWSPVAYQDQNSLMLGVTTLGTDVLLKHYVYANAGWSLGGARPYYAITYQNDQLPPTISLSLTDLPAVYAASRQLPNGTRQPLSVWERQVGGSVSATFPGLPSILLGSSWVQGQSLSVGYSWLSIDNLGMRPSDGHDPLQPLSPDVLNTRYKPSAGQLNTLSARYQFADNYRSPFAVSPEFGSVLGLTYEKAATWFGGTASYDRVSGDFRRYISLPLKHHVIAVRAAGGLNLGRLDGDYRLGGQESSNLVTTIDERYAQGVESAALRGYAPGSLVGKRMAMTSAEYRFPLYELERGTGTLPFFVTRLAGSLFADAGWVGNDSLGSDMHLGLGAEARLGLSVMFVPTELRLGWARGTHPTDGISQFIAGAGISF